MTVDHKAAFWRDVVWLIILASVWGSSFAAIKIAVHTMPPMSLVAVNGSEGFWTRQGFVAETRPAPRFDIVALPV